MTNSALTLNYKNNTIEMTSIFAKKAGIYGSKEYEMLLDARKSFPNFRVNILKPKKGQASRLKDVSLETMFKHISENDNENKEIMAAFNELVTKDENGKLLKAVHLNAFACDPLKSKEKSVFHPVLFRTRKTKRKTR